jgi:ribosomal protein L23
MNYQGKARRRGRMNPGRRADWKKAVVKLRSGDSIDLI